MIGPWVVDGAWSCWSAECSLTCGECLLEWCFSREDPRDPIDDLMAWPGERCGECECECEESCGLPARPLMAWDRDEEFDEDGRCADPDPAPALSA